MKEHKLYNKLLDKISLETESLVSGPFGKDKYTPISTLSRHIQNNPSSPSPTLL